MSTPEPRPYTIVGTPVHTSQWVEDQQKVIPGWKVVARWTPTGTIIPVFVPDSADLSLTSDALIRYQGAQLEKLHTG